VFSWQGWGEHVNDENIISFAITILKLDLTTIIGFPRPLTLVAPFPFHYNNGHRTLFHQFLTLIILTMQKHVCWIVLHESRWVMRVYAAEWFENDECDATSVSQTRWAFLIVCTNLCNSSEERASPNLDASPILDTRHVVHMTLELAMTSNCSITWLSVITKPCLST